MIDDDGGSKSGEEPGDPAGQQGDDADGSEAEGKRSAGEEGGAQAEGDKGPWKEDRGSQDGSLTNERESGSGSVACGWHGRVPSMLLRSGHARFKWEQGVPVVKTGPGSLRTAYGQRSRTARNCQLDGETLGRGKGIVGSLLGTRRGSDLASDRGKRGNSRRISSILEAKSRGASAAGPTLWNPDGS